MKREDIHTVTKANKTMAVVIMTNEVLLQLQGQLHKDLVILIGKQQGMVPKKIFKFVQVWHHAQDFALHVAEAADEGLQLDGMHCYTQEDITWLLNRMEAQT